MAASRSSCTATVLTRSSYRRARSGARCDRNGITLVLVDANAAGVSIQGFPTMDGQRSAEVTLTNVAVSQAMRYSAQWIVATNRSSSPWIRPSLRCVPKRSGAWRSCWRSLPSTCGRASSSAARSARSRPCSIGSPKWRLPSSRRVPRRISRQPRVHGDRCVHSPAGRISSQGAHRTIGTLRRRAGRAVARWHGHDG